VDRDIIKHRISELKDNFETGNIRQKCSRILELEDQAQRRLQEIKERKEN
jgi:prefoldin subunit 5